MADAIDEIYLGHLAEAELVDQPLYKCTNHFVLMPRRALSGLVEHRCPECGLVKEQSLREYIAAKGRGLLAVSCPKACASVRERHAADLRRNKRRKL
jgi:hypothetical protein